MYIWSSNFAGPGKCAGLNGRFLYMKNSVVYRRGVYFKSNKFGSVNFRNISRVQNFAIGSGTLCIFYHKVGNIPFGTYFFKMFSNL